MTPKQAIAIIKDSLLEMPEDTEIAGFFHVNMTNRGRSLLAHGDIDMSQLYEALTDFDWKTSDDNG